MSVQTLYARLFARFGTDAERRAATVNDREVHFTTDKRELYVGQTPVVRAIEDGVGMKTLVIDLPLGSDGASVDFVTAFDQAPRSMKLTLVVPSGSPGMSYWMVGLPTASGFTYALGAPTPNANYKLLAEALL